MPKIRRLCGASDWINLDFVEHERTSRRLTNLGIRLHLADLSLSNTISELENFGVQWNRKAVHDWVQKADLQPQTSNQVALDETVIRINDEQFWLYAAVDPATNHVLHVRLYPRRTTMLTEIFAGELREKHDVADALFLVDGAPRLQTAFDRHGLRFQHETHGHRNAVERVYREIRHRKSSFSNTFSHVEPKTAESWLSCVHSLNRFPGHSPGEPPPNLIGESPVDVS